ncbi:hypothetical protein RhiirA4_447639 [Rhizophagus irregularis]|uniref:Crinkler effector protein N-terminal domain-containing protein n=1 Tax=Rhizophagus irregularis TaxID=588596 RepID=A0A2I1GZ92_9GLOM|nr:hypothetical protein RhiirA4_546867 [Rhizophagus irregularis]PKY53494.1 hypothetical protein RhiirA4_447639 [Rhizophagus irregularis]
MSTITLSCLVAGENPYDNSFPVDIDTNKVKTIGHLRDAIKEKIDDNVKAKDLKLWKVDISLEEENEKLKLVNEKINVNIKDELEGVELKPLSKTSKHFSSQPADEHIHIIVQRPVETKEVHCTATYGRKSEKFLWAVTRGQITLSALKTRLRTCFAFPDGTEDEHIVIIRESGKEHVRLVDDEDLACIIWTQGFKVDLPIIVDTCRCGGDFFYEIYATDSNRFNLGVSTAQQPFSSWTFPKIKSLFGLTADSCIDLPRFDGGSADASDYKKVLEHVLEDIAMKHKTCIHVTSANEATRREFISSVLHGVASCYDGEVKVCPEYELSGSHGKGPVDWVIKIGDTIIVVTEAKREDINQGVGQNAIQLQASSQRNKKKRTYNEALREDVMYGIDRGRLGHN